MRSGSRRAALLLASAALAAGSLGAVGMRMRDDEDSGDEVTIPEISTPTETTDTSESTTTAPESGGVTPGSTGGTEPEPGAAPGGSGATTPDSATNDTPPAGQPRRGLREGVREDPEPVGSG